MEISARYDNKWLRLNVEHVNDPHLDKAGENWKIWRFMLMRCWGMERFRPMFFECSFYMLIFEFSFSA